MEYTCTRGKRLSLKDVIIIICISMPLLLCSCMDNASFPSSTSDSTSTDTASTTDSTSASSSTTTTVENSESVQPGTTGELISAEEAESLPEYSYSWDDTIKIDSAGATEAVTIYANLLVPQGSEGQTYPAIIFINSWALEEHEYYFQAIQFAKKGYIVLSYTCRGWWGRPGTMNLGGDNDIEDFKAVTDWLIANTAVDTDNIGVCGVSLGGGGALNAICHDSRIKTAVAISAWTDLFTHMYSGDTGRVFWGSLLAVTGALLSYMDTDLYSVLYYTLTNTNIDFVDEYCHDRSPINAISGINDGNKPIYIANNTEDYLFVPDTILNFFNKLTVDHKRVDLSVGTHFTGEVMGVLGFSNYVLDNTHLWFDYWLRGIDTGIIPDEKKSAVVTIQEKNYLERVEYDTASMLKSDGTYKWPPNCVQDQTFYLGGRTLTSDGTINDTPYSEKNTYDIFYSGILSGVTAGVVVFPILEQLGVEIQTRTSLLNRANCILWESEEFSSVKKIRGAANVTFRMSLSQSKGQVIVYLYDVNSSGVMTFITHGFQTFWDATANQSMDVTIPLIATAYDVPEGHHLALVVDSCDPLYGLPTLNPYYVKMYYSTSGTQNVLTVPFEE